MSRVPGREIYKDRIGCSRVYTWILKLIEEKWMLILNVSMCDSLIFIFQERIQKILPGIHGVYTPYRGHLYGVNRSSLKQRDIEIGVKNVAFSLYIDCGLKICVLG